MVKCYSVKKQTKEPFPAALKMQEGEICERKGMKERGMQLSSLFSYLLRIFKAFLEGEEDGRIIRKYQTYAPGRHRRKNGPDRQDESTGPFP